MKFLDICEIAHHFGPAFIISSLWHQQIKKTDRFQRKFPTGDWKNMQLSSFVVENAQTADLNHLVASANFFPLSHSAKEISILNRVVNFDDVISTAGKIINGKIRYFSNTEVPLTKPVDWHVNPFNRARWPADKHWSKLTSFASERGDIKSVWELSRFSWAFDLVRAYLVSGNPNYADAFWQLFEQWLQSNQPNLGVHWQCGQECALRAMALCFALFGLQGAASASEERVTKLIIALAVHADRIEKFISDAIRQRTNHAITEATGLYTIGTLFPFLNKAERWRKTGKNILEQQGLSQISPDGTYIQQSMNYHRLMLHAFLWSLRLAELNGDDFSDELKQRLLRAVEFLYQMQDNPTGRVPNYGANDGALILPLNSCNYLDYRPVIQSCWYLLKRERVFEPGPWDEDLFWIFGSSALSTGKIDKPRISSEFSCGGYYTLRSADQKSWAMIRCHTYRERVGHVDPLHLDLWAGGLNLLRDCGSYRYYAPDEPEMEDYFKSIWAHNTVVVDDCSPLRLASRFIYVPWPKAEVTSFEKTPTGIKWSGKHFAYYRSPWHVIHSREVAVDNKNRWEIFDQLQGEGEHKLELRWHLPSEAQIITQTLRTVVVQLPDSWRLNTESQADCKIKLLRANRSGGWESLYYGQKTPICTLSLTISCRLPATFKTLIRKE